MQQIRITRTADLYGVLSFLKERYPLLSEAEIIKMALSNQYHQETTRKNSRELEETPNEYLRKSLQQSEEDVKAGKVISFKSGQEAVSYVRSLIKDDKYKKQKRS
jgi:hypothetical protein